MVICDVACHVMSCDVVVTSLSFDVVFGSQWLFEPTDTGCRFWQKSLLEPTKTKIAVFLTFAKKTKFLICRFVNKGPASLETSIKIYIICIHISCVSLKF